MATLTYDPTPADQPEFNEAEQEALAIGEAQAEEEQQLLAGKFEDAEALEQAYIELQKKLGTNNEDVSEVQEDEVRVQEDNEESSEEEEEVSPAQERIAQHQKSGNRMVVSLMRPSLNSKNFLVKN